MAPAPRPAWAGCPPGLCQRPRPPPGNTAAKPIALSELLGEALTGSDHGFAAVFTYSSPQEVLAIGQEAEFSPELPKGQAPLHYRLASPAPPGLGLTLDAASGVVRVAPSRALPRRSVLVIAEFSQGAGALAVLQLEVIDFSCGGYVVGHLSEVEPGCFMMLLEVPKGKGDDVQAAASSTASTCFERNVSDDSVGSSLNVCATAKPAGAGNASDRMLDIGEGIQERLTTRTPSTMSASSLPPAPTERTARWPASAAPGGPLLSTAPPEGRGAEGLPAGQRRGDGTKQPGRVLKLEDAIGEPTRPPDPGQDHESLDAPSAGSLAHYFGICKPCAFFYKQGCEGGAACKFCHLCGPSELRKRKNEKKKANKKARQMMGRTVP